MDGNFIAYLTKEGIKRAMQWLNQGIMFIQEDANKALEEYSIKHRASDLM